MGFRVSTEMRHRIENAMETGGYASLAEVIRDAVRRYLDAEVEKNGGQ